LFKYPTNKNHRNYLQNHIKSISTRNFSNHQNSKTFLNIRSVVVTRTTACWKFHRSSESMRSSILRALWTLDSHLIVTQLSNENEVESSQPWLSDSIVVLPWSKLYMRALIKCRKKLPRKKSLRCVTATYANLDDFEKVSPLDSRRWHSTFCKSQILASVDICHFVNNVTFRPQFGAPKRYDWGQMSTFSPQFCPCIQRTYRDPEGNLSRWSFNASLSCILTSMSF